MLFNNIIVIILCLLWILNLYIMSLLRCCEAQVYAFTLEQLTSHFVFVNKHMIGEIITY